MREILFRGFHPDENGSKTITLNGEQIRGEWAYGSLITQTKGKNSTELRGAWIVDYDQEIEVIPETVGQYIGISDKDKTKIFNGDLLEDKDGVIWLMSYATGWWSYQIISQNTKIEHHCTICPYTDRDGIQYLSNIKVIGNKWEVEQ